MLEFKVTGTVNDIVQHLTSTAKRHVPFAIALGLTRTAKFIEAKEKEEMARSFDRPTPYALRSTFVIPATKSRLVAEVKIKDLPIGKSPARVLLHNITGGSRPHKRFEQLLIAAGLMHADEFAVPTRAAQLDRFGNVRATEYQKILADVKASFDPKTFSSATSRRARLRRKNTRGVTYFVARFKAPPTAHLERGIYSRTRFGFGTAIKPIFLFVSRVRYRKRFDFYRIASQVGPLRFRTEFALALRHALQTSR